MRIIFIGTPDFAVASLEALIDSEENIVGVITAPDKPAGRGKKIQSSAVKLCAEKHGLNLLQPTNLKDSAFLEELKSLNADLQVVVAFRMMPEAVWNMPKLGTFNLHGSLLPQYRGAAPINWAIINGEKVSGVTTFFLKHEIDTGSIIDQEKVEIGPNENVGDLYHRLMSIGAELVVKTVQKIKTNDYSLTNQEDLLKKITVVNSAPKLNKEICKVDWNKPIDQLHNHIRGLSPYPCAFTEVFVDNKKLKLKLYRTTKEAEVKSSIPMLITEKKRIGVSNSSGTIWINELQLEGKKRMEDISFLAGMKNEITLAL